MKFGDKLIALRKKEHMSQEDLAAKLNVSRQSVSKWESNNTYPETDKIVQICNIFECNMDDLINDKIENIDDVVRQPKNNLNVALDSFLEFITKTVDMFSTMTFADGFKCLIEVLILMGILAIIGSIGTSIIMGVIKKLIYYVPENPHNLIYSLFNGIISIIWLVIAVIILVHSFKIRYLNPFDNMNKGEDKPLKKESNETEVKQVKEEKKTFKPSQDEPFAFLSILSKIVVYFIKFVVLWILLGFAFTLVGLIAALVLCIPLTFASLCFFGGTICIISSSVMCVIVMLVLFNFIFDHKSNIMVLGIIFLAALVITGIGSGIAVSGLKNINYISNDKLENKDVFTKEYYYKDNLYFNNQQSNTNYVIDNTIEDNKFVVSTKYSKDLIRLDLVEDNHEYGMIDVELEHITSTNFNKLYKKLIKDLKNNIIRSYDDDYETITVTANEATINKLMTNLSKVYLFDKKDTETGYEISNTNSKIDINYNDCDVDYNAPTDSLRVNDTMCSCEKQTIETNQGTRIEYNCTEKE